MQKLQSEKLSIYWVVASTITIAWVIAMFRLQWWHIFADTWPISLTMVLGSFIAGATAEGGGAVAFPVFTKVFNILPENAKIFSFFIQSVGMTMAALFIYLKKIDVLWTVVFVALLAGIPGLIVGELVLVIPAPYPKLIFTFTAGVFALFLIINRWFIPGNPLKQLNTEDKTTTAVLIATGFLGGLTASVIGVGIDMLVFIVLTLRYGIDEKISTPTTVVTMGLLSVAGFIWHAGVMGGVDPDIWKYWMSSVPVVIYFAPLGAWACSALKRDQLIWFLLFLILIEVTSTFWILPVTTSQVAVLSLSFILITLLFAGMIYYRKIGEAKIP
ncbi:MAG: TSUP family transporter [Bacteroidetes bacterium]|nr:TSUP family transporter [Bacteroidota bacterium]